MVPFGDVNLRECAVAAVMGVNALVAPRSARRAERRLLSWNSLVLGGAVVAFALAIGVEPVIARFLEIDEELKTGRGPIWSATAP